MVGSATCVSASRPLEFSSDLYHPTVTDIRDEAVQALESLADALQDAQRARGLPKQKTRRALRSEIESSLLQFCGRRLWPTTDRMSIKLSQNWSERAHKVVVGELQDCPR